jgi:hypothetical protein
MPAYAVEFTAEVERGFELVFDFLEENYRSFGESAQDAIVHAHRGTRHPEMTPNLRRLTIDQAIY